MWSNVVPSDATGSPNLTPLGGGVKYQLSLVDLSPVFLLLKLSAGNMKQGPLPMKQVIASLNKLGEARARLGIVCQVACMTCELGVEGTVSM